MGLLLGGCFVLLRDFPFGVFRTAQQVTDVTGLFCAVLPAIESAEEQAAVRTGEYAVIAPHSRFVETLRSIWALINIAQQKSAAKVICVVSSVPGEGKTTVATNLAAHFARHSTTRVLLVDADLHHPSLTEQSCARREGGPQGGVGGADGPLQICGEEGAIESRRPALSCLRSGPQCGRVAGNCRDGATGRYCARGL